jgi:hypothetical protein
MSAVLQMRTLASVNDVRVPIEALSAVAGVASIILSLAVALSAGGDILLNHPS